MTALPDDEEPCSLSDAPTLKDDRGAKDPVSADEPWSEGQFLPGAVLDGRYRIVSLVGRGGMGEVYRADDLKLRQPVALKFLPETFAKDEARMAALCNEVRQSRRVTHSNVCRVHDIGEAEGRHFLSMEFIDGEDLGALLKRIGRLPRDKATQLARQLCAGLAAAHRGGVLHRDLKPANLMIDGRGNLRITDFGLAQLGSEAEASKGRIAGTPAYMAPEQLREGRVSQRSDIYALGLILYEMFTGKRVNETSDVAEIVRRHESEESVEKPSGTVEQLDPKIDEIILRCLEKDAALRPSAVEEVMHALPGQVDLLEEALAEGVTPAPAVVAAAGSSGTLKASRGIALLVATVVVLVAAMVVVPWARLFGRVEFSKEPEVLADKAREILRKQGSAEPAQANIKYGFAETASKDSVYFWYREAPSPMFPELGLSQTITEDDPPFTSPGMTRLRLDLRGELIQLEAAPAAPKGGGSVDVPMFWLRIVVGIAALILGIYHWRTGKGDRRGAAWVAMFVGGVDALLWIFAAGLSGFQGRPEVAYRGVQSVFSAIASGAFFYMALEPILRRLWPQTLISWSRLLAGNIRNPLVGRAILVGILGGAAASLLIHLGALAPERLDPAGGHLLAKTDWNRLVGPGGALSVMLDQSQRALFYGFGTGLVLTVFVAVLRSRRLATAAATIVMALVVLHPTDHVLTIVFSIAATAVMVVILIRHGVLALVVAIWVLFIFEKLPVTIAVNQWYASAGILPIAVMIALAIYGFAISTPTCGLLGGLLPEDRRTHPSPSDTIK